MFYRVTTSEEMPGQEDDEVFVALVVVLPGDLKKTIHIHGEVPNNYTVRDLLKKVCPTHNLLVYCCHLGLSGLNFILVFLLHLHLVMIYLPWL